MARFNLKNNTDFSAFPLSFDEQEMPDNLTGFLDGEYENVEFEASIYNDDNGCCFVIYSAVSIKALQTSTRVVFICVSTSKVSDFDESTFNVLIKLLGFSMLWATHGNICVYTYDFLEHLKFVSRHVSARISKDSKFSTFLESVGTADMKAKGKGWFDQLFNDYNEVLLFVSSFAKFLDKAKEQFISYYGDMLISNFKINLRRGINEFGVRFYWPSDVPDITPYEHCKAYNLISTPDSKFMFSPFLDLLPDRVEIDPSETPFDFDFSRIFNVLDKFGIKKVSDGIDYHFYFTPFGTCIDAKRVPSIIGVNHIHHFVNFSSDFFIYFLGEVSDVVEDDVYILYKDRFDSKEFCEFLLSFAEGVDIYDCKDFFHKSRTLGLLRKEELVYVISYYLGFFADYHEFLGIPELETFATIPMTKWILEPYKRPDVDVYLINPDNPWKALVKKTVTHTEYEDLNRKLLLFNEKSYSSTDKLVWVAKSELVMVSMHGPNGLCDISVSIKDKLKEELDKRNKVTKAGFVWQVNLDLDVDDYIIVYS